MVGIQTPRNISQRIPQKTVKGTAVTVGTGSTILYTVPSGKKTYVQVANWYCVALGANSYIQSRLGGTLARKATGAETNPIADIAAILILNAGETIELTGDNGGNNGTVNYFFTYQETPA